MAANFYTKTSRGIGVSDTQIGAYAVAASTQTIVLNLTVSNTTSSAVSITIKHTNGSTTTYLANAINLPANETFYMQKLVLETGYYITVASGTASSVDASMSIMEIT